MAGAERTPLELHIPHIIPYLHSYDLVTLVVSDNESILLSLLIFIQLVLPFICCLAAGFAGCSRPPSLSTFPSSLPMSQTGGACDFLYISWVWKVYIFHSLSIFISESFVSSFMHSQHLILSEKHRFVEIFADL